VQLIKSLSLYTPAAKSKYKILNILGFSYLPNIFYLFFSIFSFFKKKFFIENNKDLRFSFVDLEKNGYLKIENFIKESDLEILIKEINDYVLTNNSDVHDSDISASLMTLKKNYLSSEILEKYFGKKSLVSKFIASANGVNIKFNPPIEYRSIVSRGAEKKEYGDNQHLLHYDVTYPSYKAILYLNDTSDKNGAFKLLPASNKSSILRLIREYKNSISNDPEILNNLYSKELKNIISVSGLKNTLIIMNAKTLHSRGIFKEPGYRKTLFIDYRFLNSPLNILLNITRN
jgi:hypothetical protein